MCTEGVSGLGQGFAGTGFNGLATHTGHVTLAKKGSAPHRINQITASDAIWLYLNMENSWKCFF